MPLTFVVTDVTFTVLGHPEPGGSKTAVRVGDGVTVRDSNKKVMPWRACVAGAAKEAMGDAEPMRGPLGAVFTFYVQRPQSHYGTGRNSGTVKVSAPGGPIVRPDVTKLVRAAEDAMTSICWRDDAQVILQIARKRYGTPERCEVQVRQLQPNPNGRKP
jgi:Holliday junction resolvase RusA-like endonuclease